MSSSYGKINQVVDIIMEVSSSYRAKLEVFYRQAISHNKHWAYDAQSGDTFLMIYLCYAAEPQLSSIKVLAQECDIDFQNNFSENVLHFAVQNPAFDPNICAYLLERVNPNVKDYNGHTAL